MMRGRPFAVGHVVTVEMRAKISKARRATVRRQRQERELLRRQKISQSLQQHPVSDVTRQRLSEALRHRQPSESFRKKTAARMLGNQYTKGRRLSQGHREKLRQVWAKRSPRERALWGARACAGNRHPSSLEVVVRQLLDALGVAHEPSVQIGPYVADVLVPHSKLVIECDGDYWHSRPGALERDMRKDRYLEANGYRVLRLGERVIKGMSIEDMCGFIADAEAV